METIFKDIRDKLDIEEILETECLDSESQRRFWKITGLNSIDQTEEHYLLYDCSEQGYEFEFEKYKNQISKQDDFCHLVMIFQSWEHEWEVRERAYEKLNVAKNRKELFKWFNEKIAYYKEIDTEIMLELEEDGINYLEYISEDGELLSGRIYNVSLNELKKIFNVTGKDLFKRNVRFGLKNNSTGDKIQLKFKEYIKIGLYLLWIKANKSDENNTQIKEIFDIKNDFKIRIPENFWFYHNGVTLFCYNQNIDFSGNHIKLNPKNVSVINGAQTLTNFFQGIKRLPLEFEIACQEIIEDEGKAQQLIRFFYKNISDVVDRIRVKTVFIEGTEKFVKPITYGLNTQIPIVDEDIISDSMAVEKINKILRSQRMKIVKAGEDNDIEIQFSVLDFVKKYLIVKKEPGKSKNLRKKELKDIIQKLAGTVENQDNLWVEELRDVMFVEEWWKETKIAREENIDSSNGVDEENINKYGKNYFQSYVLCEKNEDTELDTEYLMTLFNKFVHDFKNMKNNLEMSDFKKDELFKEYQKRKNQKESEECDIESPDEIANINLEKLREEINRNKNSVYTIHRSIDKFLETKKINLSYFRVIATENNKVKEAFPFPNATFNELYNSDEYKNYTDLLFAKEVNKQFAAFIIEWENINNKKAVKYIRFIPDFSFKQYSENAQCVYNKTVQAFKDGDEKEFPQIKEDLSFHIRPKAINSEDTFEFTNGMWITKRTFWANRKTMNEIIGEHRNEEELR